MEKLVTGIYYLVVCNAEKLASGGTKVGYPARLGTQECMECKECSEPFYSWGGGGGGGGISRIYYFTVSHRHSRNSKRINVLSPNLGQEAVLKNIAYLSHSWELVRWSLPSRQSSIRTGSNSQSLTRQFPCVQRRYHCIAEHPSWVFGCCSGWRRAGMVFHLRTKRGFTFWSSFEGWKSYLKKRWIWSRHN